MQRYTTLLTNQRKRLVFFDFLDVMGQKTKINPPGHHCQGGLNNNLLYYYNMN